MYPNCTYQRTEFQSEVIELLKECNEEMFGHLISHDVYQAIVRNCFRLFDKLKICLIFDIHPENKRLKLTAYEGIKDIKSVSRSFQMGKSVIGEVAETGIRQREFNPSRMAEIIPMEKITASNITQLISFPLKIANNPLAVVNLFFNTDKSTWQPEDFLLDIFAGHASIAVQNSNLYRSLQYTLEDMDTVVQIAKEITSPLDFEQVLENILKATQKITNTEVAFLWYRDLITKAWVRRFPENVELPVLNLPKIEMGEGICGYVLKTGKSYRCQDTAKDPHYFDSWMEAKSELTLPLIIDNEVNGILDVESTQTNAFSERQERILSILAEEAAIALRNVQLYTLADRKTQQVITLMETVEALSQQKSLEEILQFIATKSMQLVGQGKKGAFVMLLDHGKKVLSTKAFCGELFGDNNQQFSIPMEDKSIVTWVANHRKPRLVPDVSQDDAYLRVSPITQSELCIPIDFHNEVIGVINIESTELNAFDEQDVELLQSLAYNASVATKIAELYEVRLKQLEALYKTGTKINSSRSLKEVLQTITDEALKAIGKANRTLYVQLLYDETNILEIKAVAGIADSDKYLGIENALDKGISGWVIRNRKHRLVSDVKKDTNYLEIKPTIKSELCVPIKIDKKIIGVINVESLKENDFGQNELELLEGLANQAGAAITNARLNEGLANMQYELIQAVELAVVGETLAELFHDVRTYASLVSGEAQWIEYLFAEDKLKLEESVASMKKIKSYINQIDQLTDDFSQRSQSQPPKYESENISEVVRQSIQLLYNQAIQKFINIDVQYESLNFFAEMDIKRIRRAFIHIIKNAIDAMPDGGRLTINCKKYKHVFGIQFQDTGVGIPQEIIEKIWSRFFTTKTEGSGLGLPICKRIVEHEHKGKVSIKSILKKGTTISIKLPFTQS